MPVDHLVLGTRGMMLLDPTDPFYIRPVLQDPEMELIYQIHRNKHREFNKMRRQRDMVQKKEQDKT